MPKLMFANPTQPAGQLGTFLGIDPGVSGGLAALLPDGRVELLAMPDDVAGLWNAICGWHRHRSTIACMELVTGYVGGYNRKDEEDSAESNTNPGAHMFRFGTNNGMLLMGLHAAGISVDLVSPRVWQKAVGVEVREKGISGTAWKNVLKARAVELFPGVKITKKTCDALLMAEYCRRRYGT